MTRNLINDICVLLTSIILKGNNYLFTGSKHASPKAYQTWWLELALDGKGVWEKTRDGNQVEV